jgi:flagellar biosynthetic protein FlhB
MSEAAGERTEQPTPRRLEEAISRGQFARSSEVQTVFVLGSAILALVFFGPEIWGRLVHAMNAVLGHLHQVPVSFSLLPAYAISAIWVALQCVAPVVLAAMVGGLLAGALQSRFQTASEALAMNWDRLNPATGLQRIFSVRSLVPTSVAILKLAAIIGLTYSEVRQILNDPIFYTTVDVARIAEFLAQSALKIILRVTLVMLFIAGLDYAYQHWRTMRDLMMTKQEVKDEMKNYEANPQVRSRQRRRKQSHSQRKQMAEVVRADVVVTNPTHLAVALRYDAKSMKAPQIVAKGARLQAQQIREIARQHQVPIIENKPLARLMFKYGRVGGEVPAQLYVAVAEILALVYRTNRFRYYAQGNQVAESPLPK